MVHVRLLPPEILSKWHLNLSENKFNVHFLASMFDSLFLHLNQKKKRKEEKKLFLQSNMV